MSHRTTLVLLFLISGTFVTASRAATPLTSIPVATGLDRPVFVTFAPGDSTRLFIVEQDGYIRILRDGVVLARPFLNIDSQVGSADSEQGLLGLAFHPQFPDSSYFYVNYTDNNGDTRISRFTVSADPDSTNPATELMILPLIDQPASNHNGGMLGFGPNDGFLYIGLGDGGSSGDPNNFAQSPNTWLGKILRIDIDAPSPLTYIVPADNPYVGTVDTLPEIWAFGLRNPWRWSFDRATGSVYIADVGQASIEEINFQPASSPGGENYGWRLKEGTACFNPPTDCDTLTGLIDPIYEYTHGGSPFRCSVTGGYVYRGCAIPDLNGTYFFGDFCSGQVWSFRYDGTLTEFTSRTAELGLPAIDISSFGEDVHGELYIVNYNGSILKVAPDGVPSQCPCCQGLRGNVNGDSGDLTNIADVTTLVNYLFKGGSAPGCSPEADVNGDGSTNVADLTYLVNFLFRGGPDPATCP